MMKAVLKNAPKFLLLSFTLSSCSPAITVTKLDKQYPDKKYLRDCGSPEFKREQSVYSDLIPYIKTLQSALELCNNDKKALRDWVSLE